MQAALGRFELLKVDAEDESGGGEELAGQFSVTGYPTFIVLDADRQVVRRWWGYGGADDTIERLAAIEADPSTLDTRRARYAEAPTAADAVALAEFHASRRENADAGAYFATAVELGDPTGGWETELFQARLAGMGEGAFDAAAVVEAAEAAFANPNVEGEDRLHVAGDLLHALADDDPSPAVALLDRALEDTADDETVARTRLERQVDRALLIDQDAELAMQYKRQALPEDWNDDPSSLNGFAWWCFEQEVNLDEAESLARRGADLAADDAERAMILDTVAEIAYLRGDKTAAIEALRQAIEADPDRDYYKDQLKRFEGESPEEG